MCVYVWKQRAKKPHTSFWEAIALLLFPFCWVECIRTHFWLILWRVWCMWAAITIRYGVWQAISTNLKPRPIHPIRASSGVIGVVSAFTFHMHCSCSKGCWQDAGVETKEDEQSETSKDPEDRYGWCYESRQRSTYHLFEQTLGAHTHTHTQDILRDGGEALYTNRPPERRACGQKSVPSSFPKKLLPKFLLSCVRA